MSDAVDRGFTVTELAPMGEPIETLRETAAAFVGRALRGPLNQPVRVRDFGEFRRRFGDVWSRSSLAPAVKAYFQHGGRDLTIVRVANGARGAMLCLPAAGSALVLRSVEPGSTEMLRAAVDYDGIDAADDERFNLTLQRIDPDSELVLDQEIFRRVSFKAEAERFVGDQLLASTLARVEHPLPAHRPETTYDAATASIHYITAAQPGTDGAELTDYDLVGSRAGQTGLFALDALERMDILYLPPPGKLRDLGPASTLAAEQYAQRHNAMLVLDPPVDWKHASDAARGVAGGIASANVMTYFPRVYHRYDDTVPPRAAGGAIAGMLCKMDRRYGVWQSTDTRVLALSRDWVPSTALTEEEQQKLHRAGINTVQQRSGGVSTLAGDTTLERGHDARKGFGRLPVRRLCLQMIHAIDEATRPSVFERTDAQLAERIRGRVSHYLDALAELGALEPDANLADCDAGVRGQSEQGPGFKIHIAFRPVGSEDALAMTLHQSPVGCRVTMTAFPPGSPIPR